MLAKDPAFLRVVDVLFALGGLFYMGLIALGVPLKSGQPKRERSYGMATAVLFALLVAVRFARPDRGGWWWLGTAGAVLCVVAGILWAVVASRAASATGEGGKVLRLRPWSLAILLLADGALLAALRWAQGLVAWVFLAVGVLALFVMLKVAWVEVPASELRPDRGA